MKVGDLAKYKYPESPGYKVRNPREKLVDAGIILAVNSEGGTLKVLDFKGQIDYWVTSYCEVLSSA